MDGTWSSGAGTKSWGRKRVDGGSPAFWWFPSLGGSTLQVLEFQRWPLAVGKRSESPGHFGGLYLSSWGGVPPKPSSQSPKSASKPLMPGRLSAQRGRAWREARPCMDTGSLQNPNPESTHKRIANISNRAATSEMTGRPRDLDNHDSRRYPRVRRRWHS